MAATDNFYFETKHDTVQLQQVTLWVLEGPSSVWDETLRYAIWQDMSNSPSTDLVASGELTQAEVRAGAVTRTRVVDADGNPSRVQVNDSPPIFYDQYEYSFELESLVGLSGRTPYWLSIYLGQVGNIGDTPGFFWQQTAASPLKELGLPRGNPHVMSNADVAPPDTPECVFEEGNPPWCNVNTVNAAADLRFQLVAAPIPGTAVLIAPMIWLVLRRRHACSAPPLRHNCDAA